MLKEANSSITLRLQYGSPFNKRPSRKSAGTSKTFWRMQADLPLSGPVEFGRESKTGELSCLNDFSYQKLGARSASG